MNRQKTISDRLLLGAIFLGLNLLCFMGIVHGRQVTRHMRVNYAHVPAHSSRRAGSSHGDQETVASMVDAHLDHASVDHFPKISLSKGYYGSLHRQVAAVANLFVLRRPELRTEPLAEQNVVSLGSAARAPGLGRAPPIAA